MTAWRTPAVGGVGEQRVEEAGADRHVFGEVAQVELRIQFCQVDFAVEEPAREVQTDRLHQRLGERVVDQPLTVGQRALGGHHRGRRTHAGRQIPSVVIGSGHHAPC